MNYSGTCSWSASQEKKNLLFHFLLMFHPTHHVITQHELVTRPFHPITVLRSNGQEKMKGKRENPSGREVLPPRYSSRAILVCSPARCQGVFS